MLSLGTFWWNIGGASDCQYYVLNVCYWHQTVVLEQIHMPKHLDRNATTFDKLCKLFSGWSIVQGKTSLTFFLHTETGRLDFWEGETKVLMQVIQFIDEITHIATQYLKHSQRKWFKNDEKYLYNHTLGKVQ